MTAAVVALAFACIGAGWVAGWATGYRDGIAEGRKRGNVLQFVGRRSA